MRILWCADSYGYGTDLMYFEPLLAAFSERFPGTVVTIDRAFPVEKYPDLPLAPILDFRRPWKFFTRRARSGYRRHRKVPTPATLRRLVRVDADLHIVIEFTPLAIAGSVLARLRHRRVLLLIESDPRLRGARGGFVELTVKRFLARRVHHVLVSNVEGAAYLRNTLGVPAHRMTVGPYLTSLPSTSAPTAADEAAERRSGPVRFLYVGSVTPLKGIDLLLDALVALEPDCAGRWTLDVVGDGPALEAVKRRVAEAGLGGSVRFHGAVPHSAVWDHYRKSDVVVSPTLSDYRSLGAFEAVNAGRPALLSWYDGATAELLRSGAAVQAIHPDDRAETSRALRRYVVDEPFLEARLLAARTPPPQFSLTSIVDNLEAAVRAAMAA